MTTSADVESARKVPDAWWTVVAVDPIAMRILPFLVDRPRITPDRLSIASLVLAVAAGVSFLRGELVLGAVLFELHFLLDCLDGKLARLRRTQSLRGGFVDLTCDLLGTAWCYGTLGHAVFAGTDHPTLALLPAVLYVGYTWSTLQRSRSGALSPARPLGRGGRLTSRFGRTPYGVEVETLALFLVPLLSREEWARAALYLATAFYVLAAARNLRATYRALETDS